MRVLGASVLVMESLTLGFAILLATKDQPTAALIYGSVISLLLFLTAGILKRRSGLYIGSILQIFMISFGFFVPSFFLIGVIFIGLWPQPSLWAAREKLRVRLSWHKQGKRPNRLGR